MCDHNFTYICDPIQHNGDGPPESYMAHKQSVSLHTHTQQMQPLRTVTLEQINVQHPHIQQNKP